MFGNLILEDRYIPALVDPVLFERVSRIGQRLQNPKVFY
jgi:hypothetical protein